jgi:hypothetical protein
MLDSDLFMPEKKSLNITSSVPHGNWQQEKQNEPEPFIVDVPGKGAIHRAEILDWMRSIYGPNKMHGNIVGPVGERPVHVCFLFANMFALNDNIRKGILSAVQSFVNSAISPTIELGSPYKMVIPYKQDYCAAELKIPYGRDYCAAIGAAIIRGIKIDPEKQSPPFFQFLRKWVQDHTSKNFDIRSFEIRNTDDEDSVTLVTAGLYQGETALHFPITSKDVATVKWLLEAGLR